MRKHVAYILVGILLVFAPGCNPISEKKNEYNIVPQPNVLTPQSGRFVIDEKVAIVTAGCSPEVVALADSMSAQIHRATGIKVHLLDGDETNLYYISFLTQMGMSKESYKLYVTPNKVIISATEPNGFFYAIQTFYQLLPNEIYSKTHVPNMVWAAPCVDIEDEPAFEYRGAMLDAVRHFAPVEYIYKFIDLLAMHKMNTFHWHLTDDQGWRIQIDKYPKLMTVASVRNETMQGYYYDNYPFEFDGKKHGGYYTKEEITAIVEYAARRYVNIIPEIEMPGHARAAIAAYPDLSCTPNKKHEVATTWGVFDDVYCPNAITFEFFQRVLDEVIELFPSPYIHIGGDECPKGAWANCVHCKALMRQLRLTDDTSPNSLTGKKYTKEDKLQSYFIKRIAKYLNEKEKKIIGWDEIMDGGLPENATVMSWRGMKGGFDAAKAGHDAIMTPTEYCYLDYYQEDPQIAPRTIGGYNTLKKTYNYNPVPYDAEVSVKDHIIGIQANCWAEYMTTVERRDYQIFPRVVAIAETGWTQRGNKSWVDFCRRMPANFERLQRLGVKACTNFFHVNVNTHAYNRDLEVFLETYHPDARIFYTTDGSDPTPDSVLYVGPFDLDKEIHLKAAAFVNGKQIGGITEKILYGNLLGGQPYTVTPAPNHFKGDLIGENDHVGGDSITMGLTNGRRGYPEDYLPWVGFQLSKDENEVVFTAKLEYSGKIQRVVFGTLNNPAMEIRAAGGVIVEVSDDGKNFNEIFRETWKNDFPANGRHCKTHTISFSPVEALYVRLKIQGGGTIQNGIDCEWRVNKPAVFPSQLFIDEIEVY